MAGIKRQSKTAPHLCIGEWHHLHMLLPSTYVVCVQGQCFSFCFGWGTKFAPPICKQTMPRIVVEQKKVYPESQDYLFGGVFHQNTLSYSLTFHTSP